jgi:hypothetical protein
MWLCDAVLHQGRLTSQFGRAPHSPNLAGIARLHQKHSSQHTHLGQYPPSTVAESTNSKRGKAQQLELYLFIICYKDVICVFWPLMEVKRLWPMSAKRETIILVDPSPPPIKLVWLHARAFLMARSKAFTSFGPRTTYRSLVLVILLRSMSRRAVICAFDPGYLLFISRSKFF